MICSLLNFLCQKFFLTGIYEISRPKIYIGFQDELGPSQKVCFPLMKLEFVQTSSNQFEPNFSVIQLLPIHLILASLEVRTTLKKRFKLKIQQIKDPHVLNLNSNKDSCSWFLSIQRSSNQFFIVYSVQMTSSTKYYLGEKSYLASYLQAKINLVPSILKTAI